MAESTYSIEAIDHLIVLVRDLDLAEPIWRALGFALTPRGFHATGGTANHLILLHDSYLELLGLASPHSVSAYRTRIEESPGLAGIAWRGSADACFERWRSAGFEPQPPTSLARGVEIDGRLEQARFRLTMLPVIDALPSPLFCCEQLTPEFVWQSGRATQAASGFAPAHPNGAERLAELIVVVADDRTGALFERVTGHIMCPAGDGAYSIALEDSSISLLSAEAYAARFGRKAPPVPRSRPTLAGFKLVTSDLAAARGFARNAGWSIDELGEHGFAACDTALGVVIEWTQAAGLRTALT